MALLHTPPLAAPVQAPDFSLSDPVGRVWTLADCRGAQGTIVMFICNHCPYVQRVADSLAADCAALAPLGVGTVAIMPNDFAAYPEDAPDKMAAFAEQHGFAFPYLVDAGQEVARAYGAVCTPDFFGLDAGGRIVWRGNAAELRSAMEHLATTGTAPEQQTPSMGCSIKWKA
ncbi:MAG TPA: thioredoxin family protein [Rhodospirillaceae bacterium]|jgi:peroxiredoxin|nr:thioredoxin family protein [Alphaproteobacteria bacterium]HBH26643.1 thioredoxin family protein [Rhodospirillaceae bacterium]